jgi:hypothetical protein
VCLPSGVERESDQAFALEVLMCGLLEGMNIDFSYEIGGHLISLKQVFIKNIVAI